jgi:lysozyme
MASITQNSQRTRLTAGLLAAAVAIIGAYEGLRHRAYLDPIGIPTICYGHTAGVQLSQAKSTEECEGLLGEEILAANGIVDRCITVPLTDGQRLALVSFAFNVGPGRAGVKDGLCTLKSGRQPQIRQRFNRGDYAGGCRALTEGWMTARGVRLPGLVRRRNEERAYCEGRLKIGEAA